MKRRIFANSRILHGLGQMTDGLYDAVSKSAAGRWLTAYDAESRDAGRSLTASGAGAIAGRFNFKKIKLFFARAAERSVVAERFRTLLSRLASSYVRQYGVFAFAFGFYGILVYLLSNYAISDLGALPISYAVFDGFMLLVSFPMMTVKKTAAESICQSRICNLILFDLFGVRRESVTEYGKGEKRINFTFVLGTLAGLLTLFVSPFKMAEFLLAVAAGYMILTVPESGMILAVILIPAASTSLLGVLIIFTTVSFIIKALRGKRAFKLGLMDWTVVLFAATVLFGGVISLDPKSSFTYAVKVFFYILSYVVIVNLICSRRWLDRMRYAVIISCVTAAAGGLVQVLARIAPFVKSERLILTGEITSFFTTSRGLATFLVMGFFFLLEEFLGNTNTIRKMFMVILGSGTVACIWFTGFYPAMVAGLIAVILFFLVYSSRTIIVLLGGALALPALEQFLPAGLENVVSRIWDGMSAHIASHRELWNASSAMARDYFWSGCGLGCYRTVFTLYANEGVASAVDSSNIYLQTIIDLGIVGLILFAACILLFAQKAFGTFAKYGGGRSNMTTAAGFAGVIAVLLIGAVDYVWADEKLLFCFWAIMGIGTAASNIRIASDRGNDRFIETGR